MRNALRIGLFALGCSLILPACGGGAPGDGGPADAGPMDAPGGPDVSTGDADTGECDPSLSPCLTRAPTASPDLDAVGAGSDITVEANAIGGVDGIGLFNVRIVDDRGVPGEPGAPYCGDCRGLDNVRGSLYRGTIAVAESIPTGSYVIQLSPIDGARNFTTYSGAPDDPTYGFFQDAAPESNRGLTDYPLLSFTVP